MTTQDKTSREKPAPPSWEIESFRFTAFLVAPVSEQRWWAELFGQEAERSASDRRAHTQQEQGAFCENQLTLLVRSNRVDWVLSAGDERQPNPGGLVSLGALPGPVMPFVDLMLRWLKASPPVARLALGAILLQPVTDKRTGYREIARYLPAVKLDPDGSSDFSYQINRRRLSTTGVPKLEINRLSKWSVAQFSFGTLTVTPASVTYGQSDSTSALRLELDVNTAPELDGALPSGKLPSLLRELVNLSLEIAEKGDVP